MFISTLSVSTDVTDVLKSPSKNDSIFVLYISIAQFILKDTKQYWIYCVNLQVYGIHNLPGPIGVQHKLHHVKRPAEGVFPVSAQENQPAKELLI